MQKIALSQYLIELNACYPTYSSISRGFLDIFQLGKWWDGKLKSMKWIKFCDIRSKHYSYEELIFTYLIIQFRHYFVTFALTLFTYNSLSGLFIS